MLPVTYSCWRDLKRDSIIRTPEHNIQIDATVVHVEREDGKKQVVVVELPLHSVVTLEQRVVSHALVHHRTAICNEQGAHDVGAGCLVVESRNEAHTTLERHGDLSEYDISTHRRTGVFLELCCTTNDASCRDNYTSCLARRFIL